MRKTKPQIRNLASSDQLTYLVLTGLGGEQMSAHMFELLTFMSILCLAIAAIWNFFKVAVIAIALTAGIACCNLEIGNVQTKDVKTEVETSLEEREP